LAAIYDISGKNATKRSLTFALLNWIPYFSILGSRMNLRKEVQVWYKHSMRIVKQWTYEKVTPLRKALVVPQKNRADVLGLP